MWQISSVHYFFSFLQLTSRLPLGRFRSRSRNQVTPTISRRSHSHRRSSIFLSRKLTEPAVFIDYLLNTMRWYADVAMYEMPT